MSITRSDLASTFRSIVGAIIDPLLANPPIGHTTASHHSLSEGQPALLLASPTSQLETMDARIWVTEPDLQNILDRSCFAAANAILALCATHFGSGAVLEIVRETVFAGRYEALANEYGTSDGLPDFLIVAGECIRLRCPHSASAVSFIDTL